MKGFVLFALVLFVACGSKNTNDESTGGGGAGGSGGSGGSDACGDPECTQRFPCCATGAGLMALKNAYQSSTICATPCGNTSCNGFCNGDGSLTLDCLQCTELETAIAQAINDECSGSACLELKECLASCWPLN